MSAPKKGEARSSTAGGAEVERVKGKGAAATAVAGAGIGKKGGRISVVCGACGQVKRRTIVPGFIKVAVFTLSAPLPSFVFLRQSLTQ